MDQPKTKRDALCNLLTTHLKTRGGTLKDLAKDADIPVTTLSSVILGKFIPGAKHQPKIAKTLGVPPEEFKRLCREAKLEKNLSRKNPLKRKFTLEELTFFASVVQAFNRPLTLKELFALLKKKEENSEAE